SHFILNRFFPTGQFFCYRSFVCVVCLFGLVTARRRRLSCRDVRFYKAGFLGSRRIDLPKCFCLLYCAVAIAFSPFLRPRQAFAWYTEEMGKTEDHARCKSCHALL
ncbi:unnamed protein product, partial [Phaeothamnion confervicola]